LRFYYTISKEFAGSPRAESLTATVVLRNHRARTGGVAVGEDWNGDVSHREVHANHTPINRFRPGHDSTQLPVPDVVVLSPVGTHRPGRLLYREWRRNTPLEARRYRGPPVLNGTRERSEVLSEGSRKEIQ